MGTGPALIAGGSVKWSRSRAAGREGGRRPGWSLPGARRERMGQSESRAARSEAEAEAEPTEWSSLRTLLRPHNGFNSRCPLTQHAEPWALLCVMGTSRAAPGGKYQLRRLLPGTAYTQRAAGVQPQVGIGWWGILSARTRGPRAQLNGVGVPTTPHPGAHRVPRVLCAPLCTPGPASVLPISRCPPSARRGSPAATLRAHLLPQANSRPLPGQSALFPPEGCVSEPLAACRSARSSL